MTAFFSVTSHGDKKIASKRIKKVLRQMGRTNDGDEDNETEDSEDERQKKRMKRKGKGKKKNREDSEAGQKKVMKRKRKVTASKEEEYAKDSEIGKKKKRKASRDEAKDGEEREGRENGRSRKGKKRAAIDSRGRMEGVSDRLYMEEEDNTDSSDDEYSRPNTRDNGRRKPVHKKRVKKDLSREADKETTQIGQNPDFEDDCDISDQELIDIAERIERSGGMEVCDGHNFTKGLRNISTDSRHKGTVESRERNSTNMKKGSGRLPVVPELKHRGRQSRKGKGAKEGSRKGKTLATRKLAPVSGPNLSSSGSDSD